MCQVNNFTFHYAFYVVMNWLPTYFDSVLHASLSGTGSVKMLPYLVMFAMSNAGGYAGEWLIARRATVARARKIVNSIGDAHGPGSSGPRTWLCMADWLQNPCKMSCHGSQIFRAAECACQRAEARHAPADQIHDKLRLR